MSLESNHYQDLFRYNSWANAQLLHALLTRPFPLPEKALGLISHLLRAQQVWLGRVQESAAATMPFWQEDTLEACMELNEATTVAWIDHLAGLTPSDLEKMISYANSKGIRYETPLYQIATHVINHSTHHRAQIALLLRQNGTTPPLTDYIYYTRR